MRVCRVYQPIRFFVIVHTNCVQIIPLVRGLYLVKPVAARGTHLKHLRPHRNARVHDVMPHALALYCTNNKSINECEFLRAFRAGQAEPAI